MLLSARGVLFGLRVIAPAVMLGGRAVSSGSILVMLGCFVMFVFGHRFSPACWGAREKLGALKFVPKQQTKLPVIADANHDEACEVAELH
jgi:hypothetical protein